MTEELPPSLVASLVESHVAFLKMVNESLTVILPSLEEIALLLRELRELRQEEMEELRTISRITRDKP